MLLVELVNQFLLMQFKFAMAVVTSLQRLKVQLLICIMVHDNSGCTIFLLQPVLKARMVKTVLVIAPVPMEHTVTW